MAYELEDELEEELEDELEDEDELAMEDESSMGEFEDEDEEELGAIGNMLGGLFGEGEFEDEDELEDEISPVRKIYPDATMEHLGELAAEAETEDEAAEHFLPLIGMAASKLLPVVAKAVAPAAKKLLPKIARAVTRATPHLTRGVGKVARTLHRNPQTRHLLKVVPAIARRTVGSVARQAAHGRHVTPHTAVRTLARQAKRVLAHPAHRRHALRQHRRLEHHFHRRHGHGITHPHGRSAYGWRLHGRRPYGAVGGRMVRGASGGVRATGGRGAGVRGVAHAGLPAHHGAASAGHRSCPPCPSCGGAPAYCRCCGQIIR